MNKLILFLIIISLLLVNIGAGLSNNITLNASIPNDNETTNLIINLLTGANLTITPINISTRLDYIFPLITNFDNDSKIINFTIRLNDVFLTNTTLNSTFLLSNDLNSNQFNYSIITKINANPLVTLNETDYLEIINGDFIINISSNLIPKSGYLEYNISGLYGTTLNIDCSQNNWLVCPPIKTFDSNNLAKFTIYYEIPEGTSIGNYNKSIYFKTNNLTINKSITFKIKEPDYLFESYQFKDDCFEYDKNNKLLVTYDCIQDQEEYNIRRLTETISRLKNDLNESCKVDPEIEYVVVGDIQKDIYDSYNTCSEDIKLLNNDYNIIRKNYSSCQNKVNNLNIKLLNGETDCLSNAVETSAKLQKDAIEKENLLLIEKSKYKKDVWNGIIFFIILILIILAIFKSIVKSRNLTWIRW